MGSEVPAQQWSTYLDPATSTRKGLCPVNKVGGRDSSTPGHSLYFEQHGTGPIKVVFIIGCVQSYYFCDPVTERKPMQAQRQL